MDELISRVKSQSLIGESLSHSTGEAEAVLKFLDGITTIVEMEERQGRFGCISHAAEGLCVGQCVGCKVWEVNRDVLDPCQSTLNPLIESRLRIPLMSLRE